jgi:hypothetical protein
MAKLTVQQLKRSTGLVNPAHAAVSAAGDTVEPGPTTFLSFVSTNASAITVTVATPGKVKGLDVAEVAVTIPASGRAFVGPLDAATFADPATGQAAITYTLSGASLTVAAIALSDA